MSEIHKCPICSGSGNIYCTYGNPLEQQTSTYQPPVICHGCNGKGWVSTPARIVMSRSISYYQCRKCGEWNEWMDFGDDD